MYLFINIYGILSYKYNYSSMKENILVTGSAGFIGFSLCKKLIEKGKSLIGIDNIDALLKPPPADNPQPLEAGFENNQLLMGQPAQAFVQQDHDAHIAAHMALLKTPPVQSNAMVQAAIHAHIMQHLQMKADLVAQQQMPPEQMQQYQQLQQQAQNVNPQEALQIQTQAKDLLAQYSAPIFAELVTQTECTNKSTLNVSHWVGTLKVFSVLFT